MSQAVGHGVEHRDDCDMELLLGVGMGDGNKEMTCCYPRESVARVTCYSHKIL